MCNQRPILIASAVMMLGLLAGAASGQEIRPGIHRLHGISASLANDDLEPVAQFIGDAPVVGLGESYHTSGGFYRLKYRVFRYLVEEQGFRVFALESPWEYAESVAAYVDTCEGDADQALRGIFGVWQGEAMLAMVRWMCIWNARHPDDRVHFFGFDEQQPERDGPALREYLRRFGLKDDDPRIVGLDQCTEDRRRGPRLDAYNECIKRLDQLWRFFDRREERIIREHSREDLEWARIRLVAFRAWQSQTYYRYRDRGRSFEARDEAMAYIFSAIRALRYPGARTVIWAHNGHIQKSPIESYGASTMGTFLADALGDDYVSLALVAYRVGLDWPNMFCGTMTVLESSVEGLLHGLGEPYLFVDLDFPGAGQPFLEPGRQYVISWSYTVPREQWDGLLFLDYSPPMEPLRWEACQ